MCYFSDGAEVHLDGALARLVFCVDGDPVAQVAMRTRDLDILIADYIAARAKQDERSASILAFGPAHADTA